MEQQHRDRSEGWQYAKLTGHLNEAAVCRLLNESADYQRSFLEKTGYSFESVQQAAVGGLHEKNVDGVLGSKTKSKTDLKVFCESGRQINVSIKKSPTGQAYLVRVDLFIQVYEKQFQQTIPADVQRAMRLFWAAADDAVSILKTLQAQIPPKDYKLQMRHKSLCADTLRLYNVSLYEAMLRWFRAHMREIVRLSFAMGAASDPKEWSEFIWYINLVGDNSMNHLVLIEKIAEQSAAADSQEICYGTRNGGTTIQLPFGMVQWHQSQMQFRHDVNKISSLMKIS